jgi:hypothetical protein
MNLVQASAKKPLTHIACRRSNANIILKYQVGKNEKEIIVS